MTRISHAVRWLHALAFVLMAPAVAADSMPEQPASQPMQPISLERWETILGEQKSLIVVADLWASWCVSCIERFPKMVAMSHRHAGSGVRFMTLNLDDPQDRSGIGWANEFLARMGGNFSHFHLDENLTRSFEALDLKSLPVVLLYDGKGEERFRLTNDNPNEQFTERDVERAIATLLEERAKRLTDR